MTANSSPAVPLRPDWRAHYEQATAQMRGGNPAAAEAICKEILARDKSQHPALNILGSIFHQRGEFREAAEAFRNAAILNPASADYVANFGAALMDMGLLERAINTLREALRLAPEHHLARFMLGNAYCRHKMLPEAVACYREVLANIGHGPTGDALFGLITTMLADQDWLRAGDGEGRIIPARPAVRELIERLAAGADTAGRRAALQEFMQGLAAIDVDHFDIACLALLWRQLEAKGWYEESPDLPRPLSREHFVRVMGTETLSVVARMSILSDGCLAYKPDSARQWNNLLCDEYVVPAISSALENGHHLLATYLHWDTVTSCGQQPLTEENWFKLDAQVRPMFAAAAAKLRELYPPAAGAKHHNPVPHVAITSDWAITGNSGDGVLFRFLAGLARLDPKPFQATVYPPYGISARMSAEFQRIGIPVCSLGDPSGDVHPGAFVNKLLDLRSRMRQDGIDCLIHMGNYEVLAFFLGALQMAPVQLFWSTGFTHIDVPFFDGYISGAALGPSNTRSSHAWWQGPPPIEDFFPPADSPAYQAIRDKAREFREGFAEDTIFLGSIARASKIDNPSFVGTLARILKANPHCVFLWCGAAQEPETVRKLMEEHGIHDRCVFKGWVDGPTMALALDIHLDAFPFSSGISMYETMSAGRAFAWMDGKEARQVSAWATGILPWIEGRLGTKADQEEARSMFIDPATGENLFVIAADADRFVANVQRLIDEPDYRDALGRAGRLFLERFVFDLGKCAKTYGDFIADAIARKRAAPG